MSSGAPSGWDMGTGPQGQWAPFMDAQCHLAAASQNALSLPFIISNGVVYVQLSCAASVAGYTYLSPYILAADIDTGKMLGAKNVSFGDQMFFSCPLAALPSGDVAFCGGLGTNSSGVAVVNATLDHVYQYVSCSGDSRCTALYTANSPSQVRVSAYSDLLFTSNLPDVSLGQFLDVSFGKGLLTSLKQGWSDGTMGYSGQDVYIYNYQQNGSILARAPLPLLPSSPIYPIPIPALDGIPPSLSYGIAPVTDSHANVYVVLNYVSASFPLTAPYVVSIASLTGAGAVQWQINVTVLAGFGTQVHQLIMTDDESLVVYTQSNTKDWWSAAFKADTGVLAWNVSYSSWKGDGNYAPLCTSAPVPLANATLLYQCSWSSSSDIYLYAVDHRTGTRLTEGSVYVQAQSGVVTPLQFDSGMNVIMCGDSGQASWGQPISTWCVKKYLPSCIYGKNWCALP
eukprot:TRINITY_DN647_c0_g1_i5.p1 TRINITY_DN647_c0_g1~~TRINITY_DN647_c0_g1_i5.p1  ORF type:complete len:455 (+),score=82.33 TRINITY_DN647_c0_g1_i5:751-2115(+)